MNGEERTMSWTFERCAELDRRDDVGKARERFLLDDDVVYLDGNSLGALPASVPAGVSRVVEEWESQQIRGWNDAGWLDAPERVGDKIGRLVGARPGEVLVADSTTIVLVKLLGAALAARPGRRVILSSTDNFPTDLYAAAGLARLIGNVELRIVARSELMASLDEEVAVLCLTHVDFRTGELHDLGALTDRAHEVGALALWDLCHSAGALVVDLEARGVDLAVGCCYKYLNGGPGAPSFLYVRRTLQDELENPLPGWLGHDAPFEFSSEWRPASGIRRFLTSSPPVVALAALESALDAFEGVELAALRAKSGALGNAFIEAVEERLPGIFEVASPRDAARRGSQVSLRHPDGEAIMTAMIERGVIGDFRAPDLCRFGFAPLYVRYVDVLRAAEELATVMTALAS